MQINVLRKEIKEKRMNMSNSLYSHYNDVICNKIKQDNFFSSSKVIYCYCSVNNEVNIDEIIRYSLEHNKIVALPKVSGDNMDFYVINSLEDTKEGVFNVMEPTTNVIAPNPDIVIVPGLLFTLSGKRIGYGKGYYDKYLSKHKTYKLGVAFDFQIQNDFQIKSHDIILDKIITN